MNMVYYAAISIALFIFALTANAAVFNNVATVTKARCYANCLTEVAKSSGPDPSCHSSLCKECIKPCQAAFTTITECNSNCKNSNICRKSCQFLLTLKNNGNVLEGKDTITDKPGIPVEVIKNITSITLSWKPVNTSEGNVVYLLKERITGDFNVRPSEFANVVLFQPKAVLSIKQVCRFAHSFRHRFNGIKFHFMAVALTENSSIVASPESAAMEMTRPNPVVHVAIPHFRYDPTSIGDKLRLTTTVTPSSEHESLITRYAMAWRSAFCQPIGLPRHVLTKGNSTNITMVLYEKLKPCNHTLKVYSLMECIPSLPSSLTYTYRGCRFVENFNKTFCHSFDPPPTPDSARAVRNLTYSTLQITEDFRVNTTFSWVPPTFPFGQVNQYHVAYGDVANLFLGKIWIPKRVFTKQTSLRAANLLPNITVRVVVTPQWSNAVGIKRTILFSTPAVPEDKIKVQNVKLSKFTFSASQLFSVRVTWQQPLFTNGLLGYRIKLINEDNRKTIINVNMTSHMLTGIFHNETLLLEIKPIYKYAWIKPSDVKITFKAPAPLARDLVVRNLKLSGYTVNDKDHTYDVKFVWDVPVFAMHKAIDHYLTDYHLVGHHGRHVHCPLSVVGDHNESCGPVATNTTNYLIPRVSPWHFIILTVKPVFKDSPFVHGLSETISIKPLKFTCKGRKPGFYKDPLDCTAYYHCSFPGQSYHFYCQEGLYWNDRKKTCDWRRNGNCKQRKKSFCDGKGTGYYQDPDSCRSFYHCDGYSSVAHRSTCPFGLYWNQQKKSCDWPNNVPCKDVESY